MRKLVEAKIKQIITGVNKDIRVVEGVPLDAPLPSHMTELDLTKYLANASDQEMFDLLVELLKPF